MKLPVYHPDPSCAYINFVPETEYKNNNTQLLCANQLKSLILF